MKPAKAHPNATVAAGGSSLAVLIVWLSTNVAHWSLSAEEGSIIAGAVSAVVLLVGHEGVRGIWRRLIDGAPDPPPDS